MVALKIPCFVALAFVLLNTVNAQNYPDNNQSDSTFFSWPEGIKMGLSLTFDDARLSQADNGIPLLDKYNVKATFYVSPPAFTMRLDTWKKSASNGHEIGNHSLVHPCSGNIAFSRDRALEDYNLDRMHTELDSASRLIKDLVGINPVSFAYPCGQTFVGRGINTRSYVPAVASLFQTGRGWLGEAPNDPAFCDLAQLTGMKLDGQTFEEILVLIEGSRESGHWLVLAGHEMGGEGNLVSSLETIEAICRYASDPANGIWIDTVSNIASYIEEKRTQ
ncbi:MAG: polysaccharide deacetylase family protein [Bacteroidales bacterium]